MNPRFAWMTFACVALGCGSDESTPAASASSAGGAASAQSSSASTGEGAGGAVGSGNGGSGGAVGSTASGGGAGGAGGGGQGGTGGSGGAGGGTGGSGGSGGSGGAGGGSVALDPAFGVSGRATVAFGENGDELRAAARQPDGKVVLVGVTTQYEAVNVANAGEILVVRIHPDGTLDETFGAGGKVLTQIHTRAEARAVAVQPDGKILVAGHTNTSGPIASVVVRYAPDGSLDGSFGGGKGYVVDPSKRAIHGVLVQPDGKIVTFGQLLGGHHLQVTRHLADGALDASFGTSGVAVANFGAPSVAHAVGLDAGGRIVAAGEASTGGSTDIALARFLPDGQLDPSFDGDGKLTTAIGSQWEEARGLGVQDDGRVVVVGTTYLGSNGGAAFVLRYEETGALDPSFGGGDGAVTFDVASAIDVFESVTVEPKGAIVAAGSSHGSASSVVRLLPDGTPDSSFGGDGVATELLGQSGRLAALVALEDGTYVVAGSDPVQIQTRWDFVAARVDGAGSLDGSFGGSGLATHNSGASKDFGAAFALQANGGILAAGTIWRNVLHTSALARFTPSGALDPAFGSGGTLELPTRSVRALAVTPSGKVAALGPSGAKLALCQYDDSGAPDAAFGAGGVVLEQFVPGKEADPRALALDASGRLVVAGSTLTEASSPNKPARDLALMRFLPDGSLDLSFGADGRVVTELSAHADVAHALAVQPDGKIVVAAKEGLNIHNAVAVRYEPDGSVDASFGLDGKVALGNLAVRRLALQPDGRILAAGIYGLELVVARLEPNGALDPGFGQGGFARTKLDGAPLQYEHRPVLGLALEPDGRILAATSGPEDGLDRMLLVRLLPHGAPDVSLGPGGKALLLTGAGNWGASELLRQSDGRLLLGGWGFSPEGGTDFGLARVDL